MEENAHKNEFTVFPMILILLGILLLLSNFNILNYRIWNTLFKLWPLIFVYLGIDMLTRNSRKIRPIATVLLLAATVFLVLYFSEQQIPYLK